MIVEQYRLSGVYQNYTSCIAQRKMCFYPQSGATERQLGSITSNTGPMANVECDAEQTTCFVEAEQVARMPIRATIADSEYEIRDQRLKDFFAKPKLVSSGQWTTGAAANSVLYSVASIGSLLTSNVEWNNKLLGFGLIRGTAVFRVELNASPFQAGLLMGRFIPSFNQLVSVSSPITTQPYDMNLVQKYQLPHVLIDARNTAAEIRVPWTSPFPWYDIRESTQSDWGKFALDVVSPLAVGPSASTYAEFVVYVYWEDIELAAPTVPQMGKREKLISVETRETPSKPISSTLRAVTTAANALGGIPYIGSYMSSLSWATNIAASVASMMGFGKPRTNTEVMIMTSQQMRYAACSDGVETAVPLALNHDNSTMLTDRHSYTDEDEMSWAFLKSIPHYLATTAWPATSVSGSLLVSRKLYPGMLFNQGISTVGSHPSTYNTGGPIYYLGSYFALWRGSFTVNLKFVKTQFHSGRLQITWTPGTDIVNSPTLATAIYSLRTIVDIREQDTVTLNLPYLVSQDYLNMNTTRGNYYYGQLDIVVLNDLKAPETCAQTIQMVETYTGGDDLEFAGPTTSAYHLGPFYPQSGGVEKLVDTGVAESKVRPLRTANAERCTGGMFSSIKQLLNRLMPVLNSTSSAWEAGSTQMAIDPYFIGAMSNPGPTGVPVYGQTYGDGLSVLAQMYAYMRGGLKVSLAHAGATYNATFVAAYTVGVNGPSNSLIPAATSTLANGTSTVSNVIGTAMAPFNGTYTHDSHSGQLYVQAPYIATTPVVYVPRFWNTRVATVQAYTIGQVVVNAVGGSLAATTPLLQRGALDDFQLTCFLGCPPVLVAYS